MPESGSRVRPPVSVAPETTSGKLSKSDKLQELMQNNSGANSRSETGVDDAASARGTRAALPSHDSFWTRLQYRILKRLRRGEPRTSESAFANRSKIEVLLGRDLLDGVRDLDVLDFGCGEGSEAIELASTARAVYGLDIRPQALARARERAAAAGLSDKCTFGSVPPTHHVDVIVSDAFEHFADPGAVLSMMFELLRPGGRVIASFGPTWYHPLGGHLFSVFPWAHLLFSESALIRWRNDVRADGARRFSEVEGGLNELPSSALSAWPRRARLRSFGWRRCRFVAFPDFMDVGRANSRRLLCAVPCAVPLEPRAPFR